MVNLFSFLGNFGASEILKCENNVLPHFFMALTGISRNDLKRMIKSSREAVNGLSLENLFNIADSFLDGCRPSPGGSFPKGLNTPQTLNEEVRSGYVADKLAGIFADTFIENLDYIFNEDIHFLMAASLEYSRSFRALPIPNGSSSQYDPVPILNDFIAHGSIKRDIDASTAALLHRSAAAKDFRRAPANLRAFIYRHSGKGSATTTVCPQFFRLKNDPKQRKELNDSVYDIGVSYGLIKTASPGSSPFIRPETDFDDLTEEEQKAVVKACRKYIKIFPKTFPSDEDPKDDRQKRRKGESVFDIDQFLQCFRWVWLAPESDNHNVDVFNDLAELLQRYETGIAPETYIVMQNFMLERITNYQLLRKLFLLKRKLDEHIPGVFPLLQPLCEELMLLPLQETRLKIVDAMDESITTLLDGAGSATGRGILDYSIPALYENIRVLMNALLQPVRTWNRVTTQLAVLFAHFLVFGADLDVPKDPYFKKLFDDGKYDFFRMNYASDASARKKITDADQEMLDRHDQLDYSSGFRENVEQRQSRKIRYAAMKDNILRHASKGPKIKDSETESFNRFADSFYKRFNETTLGDDYNDGFYRMVCNFSLNYHDIAAGRFFQYFLQGSAGALPDSRPDFISGLLLHKKIQSGALPYSSDFKQFICRNSEDDTALSEKHRLFDALEKLLDNYQRVREKTKQARTQELPEQTIEDPLQEEPSDNIKIKTSYPKESREKMIRTLEAAERESGDPKIIKKKIRKLLDDYFACFENNI